jgi:hypothetical protein
MSTLAVPARPAAATPDPGLDVAIDLALERDLLAAGPDPDPHHGGRYWDVHECCWRTP